MKVKLSLPLLIFIPVFLFISILFLHEYNRYPFEAHGEEQAFAWAGFSYLKNGIPRSWSHFDYPESSLKYKGVVGKEEGKKIGVKLVEPWFDHPPLFSILTGIGPYLSGYQEIDVFPNSLIRFPNAAAFILLLGAIFLFAKDQIGWKMAIVSMILFGTTPSYVFGGRLAVPEVFFALFYVLMLHFWSKYELSKNFRYLIIIGTLSGLAGLMKITGFLLLPLFIFFLIRNREFRRVLLIVSLQIPFILYLLWYANSLNFELFMQIIARQSFRPVGFTSLPFIFSSPGWDISSSFDGWYVLGLVSSFFILFNKSKKLALVRWGTFYWFSVLIFTSGQQDMLPWYRFPMYPLLSISLALFLAEIYKKPSFFGTVILAGMLLSGRHYISNAFRPDVLPKVFRLEFIILMIPALFHELKISSNKIWSKAAQIMILIIILIGIFLNTKYIYSVYAIRCESVDCPIGPGNRISEIHLPFVWRFLVNR